MTIRRPRIIVGCDGSPESREAVRWATRYAHRTDGALHLVATWEWPTFQDVPIVYGEFDPRDACEKDLRRARQDIDLDDDRVSMTVTKGNPARVLLDLAHTSDLLVVGSHGLGVLSRFVLGSVSARCAAHAECPVVVVRHGDDAPVRPHVLVGVDDSPSASAALRWAMDYADLAEVPLTVVHAAAPPPPPIPAGYPMTFSYPRAAVHRSLRSWLRDLLGKEQADRGRELRNDVTLRVLDGNPAHVMVEESALALVTVVGRRGAGGFGRLVMGSVASALAHHGQSTVVVVPPV